MRLSRALALTHEAASATHSLDELGVLLDPDLVSTALETAGVATLRKRRLPLEAMIWCVIAMALFRKRSINPTSRWCGFAFYSGVVGLQFHGSSAS